MAMVQLPVGSTLEQTQEVHEGGAGATSSRTRRTRWIDHGHRRGWASPAAARTRAWPSSSSGTGTCATVRSCAPRPSPARRCGALAGIRGATIFAFPPPAVTELGAATGFDFMLAGPGRPRAREVSPRRCTSSSGMAAQDPRLARVRPNGMPDVAQYKVDIDWEKAGALGVPVSSIQSYLSTAFGSAYVSNFVQGGRVKRVYAQADAPFRMLPSDLDRLHVRNRQGGLVPLSALATGRWVYGSPRLERYNGVAGHEHPGRGGAGPQHRRGHEGDGGDRRPSCPRASATSGPASPTSSAWPSPRPGSSTPSRSWPSSWSWPRSTRAGPCRSRSCWPCRSASSAASLASSLRGHAQRRLLPDRAPHRARA